MKALNLLYNKTLIYIVIAYIFSVAIRFIWVYQFGDYPSFKFNHQFMITTNDGYFYAEGARDIINGFHQPFDLSPVYSALSQITAFLYLILPFSFETVIFYMPIFLSSLIVIPLVLIGKALKNIELGFVAALFGSISHSYYNRTMAGYYDTDMLNIVFPILLVWSLIFALKTKEDRYILFTSFEIIAYRWWYPQSYALEFAFFILISIYVIYLFIKKHDYTYEVKLLLSMLVAMIYLPELMRFVGVVFLYLGFKQRVLQNYIYYILFFTLIVFVATGGISPIIEKLENYIFQVDVITLGNELKLHFYTTMKTIQETSEISLKDLGVRINGNAISFVFAIIGLIWLFLHNKYSILLLPLLGLGLLSYGIPGIISGGGLRFTIYAVPVFALGLGFFIYQISQYIKYRKISFFILSIMALIPNIHHILEYKVPTYLYHEEAKALSDLSSIANREDYVVTWWDYGCPTRYYSDVKTLIDHGKHGGSVSFPISYALNAKLDQAVKLLRLDVEYTEKSFQNEKIDVTNFREHSNIESNISKMTKDYGYDDVNKFLKSLGTNVDIGLPTRDIYLYLPHRMLDLYTTISQFSNLDIMTGKKYADKFFFQSKSFNEKKNLIELEDNVVIFKNSATIQIKNHHIPIKRFVTTYYEPNSTNLKKKIKVFHTDSKYNVVYLASFQTFLIMEDEVYDSMWLQLYLFENYDKDLIEPIILNKYLKIYKIKI